MVGKFKRRAGAPAGVRRGQEREIGQTSAEYAALIALFAVVLIAAIVLLRTGVIGAFDRGASTAGAFKPPVQAQCDPNYEGGCVPPYPPDVDCDDLEALGIPQVTVTGSDPHDLDPDGDGIACN